MGGTKMNWLKFVEDIQLIILAMVLHNSVDILYDGFSWLGFVAMLSGIGFVVMVLIMKHTSWEKNGK